MKYCRVFLAAAVCAVIAACSAFGADFKSVLKMAQKGDTEAQYEVGYMYLWGRDGAPWNSKKAIEWYVKAAGSGHVNARNELGIIYATGRIGIKTDYSKAQELFLKAGADGCGNAFGNLAWMYMKGIGFEVDYQKAIEYFTKGANLGDRECMMNLGWIYSQGLGVSKDSKKAREWYDKATKISGKNTTGHISDNFRLMEDYHYPRKKTFFYRPYDYVDPDDLLESLTKRAETGDAKAMVSLGNNYSGIWNPQAEKNIDKALEWYRKAEAANDPNSFFSLGVSYYFMAKYAKFIGYDKAIEYYEKALAVSTKNGDTRTTAQTLCNLGDLYREEIYDSDKAIQYYEKVAAIDLSYYRERAYIEIAKIYERRGNYDKALEYYEKLGTGAGLLTLGWKFEQGIGGKPDYQKAFRCYKLGAEAGDSRCMLYAARMYENGLGTPKDMDKAIEFYRKAVKGSAQARKALARLNVPVNAPAKKKSSSRKKPSAPAKTSKQANIPARQAKTEPPAKQNPPAPQVMAEIPQQSSVPAEDNSIDTAQFSRPRVAVMSFSDKSEEGKAPADAIMDMMVTELHKAGFFTLLERTQFKYVIDELKLAQEGYIDPSTAPRIARAAGAQYFMTGSVTMYYYSEKASGFVLPVIGTSAKAQTAYVVIDIRIIDAESGEIVYAYDQTGDATNKEKTSIGNSSKMTGGLLGLATRNAVSKHVSAMRGLKLEI